MFQYLFFHVPEVFFIATHATETLFRSGAQALESSG